MSNSPENFQPSREEQAKIQKERTVSDAELLRAGAEYVGDSEGGFRLEVTSRQQVELHREMEQAFSKREEDRLEAIRQEIRKELDELPIEQILQSHPELAEKIEAIRLEKDGQEISLIRQKGSPELAIPVWSKSKHRGGTQGRVLLNVPESRLPKGMLRMEFRAVCACCGSETYGLESPFRTTHPKYPEYKKAEGESESEFKVRHDREVKKYEGEEKIWKESDEAKKDTEWHAQKKQEYKEALQNACTQNGIKTLVMRNGERVWADHYGALEGVDMMEITDEEKVHGKMDELRTLSGQDKEKVPSFEVRS